MTVQIAATSAGEILQGVHVGPANVLPHIGPADDIAPPCRELTLQFRRADDGLDPIGKPNGIAIEELIAMPDHLEVEGGVEGKGGGARSERLKECRVGATNRVAVDVDGAVGPELRKQVLVGDVAQPMDTFLLVEGFQTSLDWRVEVGTANDDRAWRVRPEPVDGVKGELDVSTCEVLRAQLLDVIDKGASDIVIDMADLSFMDSSGLRGLIEGVQRGAQLTLRRLQPAVQLVFDIVEIPGITVQQ